MSARALMRSRRAQRGQAVVETSLGILVFVTVLMFGIFFAEVAVAGMKVTEAASSALWDSTAGKHHTIPTSYEADVDARLSDAMTDANDRYQDFDGRTVANGQEPNLVFSAAKDLEVECQRGNSIAFNGTAATALVYRDNGGVSCNAEAMVSVREMPKQFNEGGDGHFKAQHQDGQALQAGIKLCAMGRPAGLNGQCEGEMAMMMDDWGLSKSENEAKNCTAEWNPSPVPYVPRPCENTNYQQGVFAIYGPAILAAERQNTQAHFRLVAQTLQGQAAALGALSLAAVNAMQMSAQGEDSSFLPFIDEGPAGSWKRFLWPTTPMTTGSKFPIYGASYVKRERCYLGRDCNLSTRDAP
jgi:hypothetical protein